MNSNYYNSMISNTSSVQNTKLNATSSEIEEARETLESKPPFLFFVTYFISSI